MPKGVNSCTTSAEATRTSAEIVIKTVSGGPKHRAANLAAHSTVRMTAADGPIACGTLQRCVVLAHLSTRTTTTALCMPHLKPAPLPRRTALGWEGSARPQAAVTSATTTHHACCAGRACSARAEAARIRSVGSTARQTVCQACVSSSSNTASNRRNANQFRVVASRPSRCAEGGRAASGMTGCVVSCHALH